MRHRGFWIIVAACAAVTLAGCGKQADCAPSGAPPAAPESKEKSRYAFGLPCAASLSMCLNSFSIAFFSVGGNASTSSRRSARRARARDDPTRPGD